MNFSLFSSLVLVVFSTSMVFAHGGAPEKSTERRVINSPQQLPAMNVNGQEMKGKLIHEKTVGDFELKFKIVDVSESVPDGGSHNLLVNIKRDGRIQKRLSINSTVDDMHGAIISKSMMELGDWHLAGYDINHDNKYSITISFKSMGGVTHSTTFNYP